MAVAALLDLGADQAVLEKALESLPINGFSTKISRVRKAGLDACDFHVILQQENHDHDMEYLHPKAGQKPITATHKNAHTHHHMHRGLSDVLSIIRQADMSDAAKQTATKIFTILGEAEAKAHGTPVENVHFHEVGAIDSIVDVISAAVCLDNLEISDVIIPALHEGCGTIRCQHGILPVPVPATANIVQAYGIPLQVTDTQGEFVTPTGAAIAAAIRSSGQLPGQFRILRIGLGAGKRAYERPSVLRAMLIEAALPSKCPTDADAIYKLETNMDGCTGDVIYKLETDMDDCTGEMMGYVLECLMGAGARDVHYFPVYMKKNRPAYQLDVLCKEADIPKLEQIIFNQTTTIGIRRQRMERTILPRKLSSIQTAYGEVQVKVCELGGRKRLYPEYDSVARICRQTGSPYPETYRKIQEICHGQCP